MEDFQRFLKPDNPTVGAGAPILASALQGPSAVQKDRILPPEVFLEQEIPGAGTGVSVLPPILQGAPAVQQGRILPPEDFLKVLQSPTKADSPPALARPVARTAPVPLAGLYAKVCFSKVTLGSVYYLHKSSLLQLS